MNLTLQDLGNIGEFVGSIGLFVSLVYLAIQIRIQNHDSRIALMNSVATRWQSFMTTLTDKELAEIWLEGLTNYPNMTPVDAQRFSTLMNNASTILDTFYRHYLEGRLSEDLWQPKLNVLKDVNAYSGARNWGEERKHWFSTQYTELMDEIRANAETPKIFDNIKKEKDRKAKPKISGISNS